MDDEMDDQALLSFSCLSVNTIPRLASNEDKDDQEIIRMIIIRIAVSEYMVMAVMKTLAGNKELLR